MSNKLQVLTDRTLQEMKNLHAFYILSLYAWHVAMKNERTAPSTVLIHSSDIGLADWQVDHREFVARVPKHEYDLMGIVLVRIVTSFEAFFFSLLETLLMERPERLPKEKKIEYGEILESNDFGEVIKKIVERELHELKFKSVSAWFEKLQGMVKMKCPNEEEIRLLAEIKATRDLFIHNSGLVNRFYIKKAGGLARGRLGQPIRMSDEYLIESLKLVVKIVKDVSKAVIRKIHKQNP